MDKPEAAEFEELKRDSLIQLKSEDSSPTELWLIQWPFEHQKNRNPYWQLADFDGQEVTMKLHHDGELGSFQAPSGKNYELISSKSHTPNVVVFQSSASDAKAVGKISRHVSLVHYPEPSELQKPSKDIERVLGQRSSATSLTNSARRTATPTQTIRPKSFQTSTGSFSTPEGRKMKRKQQVSEALEPSKSIKRPRVSETSNSIGQSDRDSKGHSTVTMSGSQDRKSNNRKRSKG